VIAFLGIAGQAEARHGGVGLGVMVGEPTAITLQGWVSHNTAIDIAIGEADFHLDNNVFYAHLEYCVMPFDLARGGSVSVPLYLGIGAVFEDDHDYLFFGARAPLGIQFNFRSAPLQLFAEVALVVWVAEGYDRDRLDVDGGGGFRIFF
jgi:hypothetical protein